MQFDVSKLEIPIGQSSSAESHRANRMIGMTNQQPLPYESHYAGHRVPIPISTSSRTRWSYLPHEQSWPDTAFAGFASSYLISDSNCLRATGADIPNQSSKALPRIYSSHLASSANEGQSLRAS
jgi:hypothetical protein